MFLRYNTLSKKFEYDGSGGLGAGPWIEIPVAYVDRVNKFTVTPQTIENSYPYILFKSTTAPAGRRNFRIEAFGDDFFISPVADDDGSYSGARVRITRATDIIIGGKLFERNRTAALGEWTSYTPSWVGFTAPPSLGNGVITGKYVLIGKTVNFCIFLQSGSTTTFGTGAWGFSLPVPPLNFLDLIGSSFIYNGLTGATFVGNIANGGFFFGGAMSNMATVPTNAGFTAATLPQNWATSIPSYLFLRGTYEQA